MKRVNLDWPTELVDLVDEVALGRGLSRNKYLRVVVEAHLASCQLLAPPAPASPSPPTSRRPAARASHPWKARAVLPAAHSLRGRE
jgi:hypothetical protein